jgi:ABC-type Fe3+/spermidine/putrescine transport system ATPase subunit
MSSAPALSARGIRRAFGSVVALDGVDLDIADGEFVTLLGPSGCGKTTLLRVIAGFERPDRGTVEIASQDVLDLPPERRPVNLVFQRYALFPHLDVHGNVVFGLEVSGVGRAEAEQRVREALEMVRLSGYERRRVDQLSGGQQQRVALARALINRPKILLLDEPLGALDLQLRKEMQLELRLLHRLIGSSFVYVTHDQEEALVMSDRIVVMRDGRIEQDGPPQDVYLRPRTRFVARFIGETNLLEPSVLNGAGGALEGLGVTVPVAGRSSVDRVAISIRPEHFRLVGRGGPRLTGVIDDSVFVGPIVRHVVRLMSGETVVVQEQPGEGRVRDRGEAVEVWWRPEDVVVLES